MGGRRGRQCRIWHPLKEYRPGMGEFQEKSGISSGIHRGKGAVVAFQERGQKLAIGSDLRGFADDGNRTIERNQRQSAIQRNRRRSAIEHNQWRSAIEHNQWPQAFIAGRDRCSHGKRDVACKLIRPLTSGQHLSTTCCASAALCSIADRH